MSRLGSTALAERLRTTLRLREVNSAQEHTTTIPVCIPGKEPHDIVVGNGLLGRFREFIEPLALSRDALIISSPRVFDLYGEKVTNALKAAGCELVVHQLFPDDEENKSVATWESLLESVHLIESTADVGRLLIVNLGGGVVGDVGAFVAACYGRGRDYIQLPTTFLGQVDCGIGGKCGVNFKAKNLIGVFYQPKLVIADLEFLKSLPMREMRSGLAEVIKYGAALDAGLFEYVEANLQSILSYDLDVLEEIVNRCFRIKVSIVEKDERDVLGIRALLNFGHTIGHAIEAATNYVVYTHGEAISIGMICACEIAEVLGMTDSELRKRLEVLLSGAGLPTSMAVDVDQVMKAMQSDKKFVGKQTRFVLPSVLGRAELIKDVDLDVVRNVVANRRASV